MVKNNFKFHCNTGQGQVSCLLRTRKEKGN